VLPVGATLSAGVFLDVLTAWLDVLERFELCEATEAPPLAPLVRALWSLLTFGGCACTGADVDSEVEGPGTDDVLLRVAVLNGVLV